MKRLLMFHSFIAGSLVMVTLLALLVGRVFGSTPDELGTREDCRLPCWNTIRPGEMGINEAMNILRNLGYRPRRANEDAGIATNLIYVKPDADAICQVGLTPGFGGLLRELILRACEPLPIGEILNQIGDPDSMLPIASVMIFQEGQTILILRAPMCDDSTPSPHATVRYISLADTTLNTEVVEQPSDLPWHGFIPYWRYGQLYPDKAVCP